MTYIIIQNNKNFNFKIKRKKKITNKFKIHHISKMLKLLMNEFQIELQT